MFDSFIPQALAQGIGGTANAATAAGKAAASEGQAGLQGLLGYVVTHIDNWVAGIVVIAVFYIGAQMSSKKVRDSIVEKKEDVRENVLILVGRITKITITALGVVIAFAINGLNFTAVIGALSLGIGFALKDIIGSFLSSLIMLIQDRVRIGDFIQVNDIMGTIVSIDTRATILQGLDGSEIVVPNQLMLSQTLISFTTNPFRRIDLEVGVDYKTSLPMVTSLIKAVIDKDKDIVVKPEPLILVNEFGESSISILIRFWVESNANWQNIRSNLANRIKKAFDEIGVSIPFPIRTLKLDEDDRALLKTIDSMKKGIVPEKAEVPSNEKIIAAANNTEKVVEIPCKISE